MMRLFALVLIVFWSCAAFAEIDCTDSGSTYCQALFAEANFKRADKELNEQYKIIMSGISSAEAKKLLVEAQRAWIIYRDKLCEFENIGGGINSINWISCKARITNQRLKDMKDSADDPLRLE